MAIREKLKDDFKALGPFFLEVAQGLNRAAKWCNAFAATPPLYIEGKGWGVSLSFRPWDSPFVHPFMIYLQSGGKVGVRTGNVHNGTALNAVSALTTIAAADGLKIALTVTHYYNTATASTYVLSNTTGAWPASSNDGTTQVTVIKIGEIIGTTLYQYVYSDQFVPRVVPPLPSTSNTYFLLAVNGVIQWVQSGTCS